MKVLLSGAGGFIGSHLRSTLEERGHRVLPLSRTPPPDGYDWSDESLGRGVEEADAVVHLAGENLFGKRWSERQKERLVASRVDTTDKLASLVARKPEAVFVSASAVGYYGPSEEPGVDEDTPPAEDFLARLCQSWEAATAPAREAGVRTVIPRFGVVLGSGGGALQNMLPPFKLGLGGPIGSGRQWVSWVHIDDVVGLVSFLLETPGLEGPYNVTAPQPVRMKELAKTLGRVLHRPAILPVPGFALRLALGEVADVLLTGQHVIPHRAEEAGYEFQFRNLEPALRDVLDRP